MADSPNIEGSGIVNLKILCNGTEMDGTCKVVSVTVFKKVNQVPRATLVLVDGDMAQKDFPVSNTDDFKPGSEITLDAGYDQKTETVFKGIVIKHGIKITGNNNAHLIVECRDKSVKMTVGRHNANYVDMTDSDIIQGLISNYGGLSSDIKTSDTTHGELVQYYCTDWDFMLSRAEVNGFLVFVDDAKVSVKPPETDAGPGLKVSYGTDIIEFEGQMDARTQFAEVKGIAWEPASQEAVEQTATPVALNEQGDLSTDDLAQVVGLESYALQTPAPIDKTGLKAWADAHMLKTGLARIRGRVKFQGSAKAKPGEMLEVEGVGNRFNGTVFLSSVTHLFTPCNWITDAEFGLDPEWFVEKPDIMAPSAAGFLPGIEGLHLGIVKQLNDDPGKAHRVQVTIPVMKAEKEGVWARIANFYGSDDGGGAFFMPEVGDEVVLGYFNNDPCHPVILGSLYSSKHPPPHELEAENSIKAIVTKSKLKLEFDDDKKVTTIETPGGNKVVLSDDDSSITLEDQNSNSVILNKDGISLDSAKTIKLTAKGKIELDSVQKTSITSKADLTLEGLNLNATAKVGLTAKANATAELSASGQTTVKGAMVMIN
nr:type VI secretion system tip protein VgrG [uncultured Desulfobacter sp.]